MAPRGFVMPAAMDKQIEVQLLFHSRSPWCRVRGYRWRAVRMSEAYVPPVGSARRLDIGRRWIVDVDYGANRHKTREAFKAILCG